MLAEFHGIKKRAGAKAVVTVGKVVQDTAYVEAGMLIARWLSSAAPLLGLLER